MARSRRRFCASRNRGKWVVGCYLEKLIIIIGGEKPACQGEAGAGVGRRAEEMSTGEREQDVRVMIGRVALLLESFLAEQHFLET